MEKPNKTKAVKAKKYWAAPDSINLYRDRKEARYFSGFNAPKVAPVALIPIDAESLSEMIAQVATALCAAQRTEGMTMNGAACAALAAIGIKKGRK